MKLLLAIAGAAFLALPIPAQAAPCPAGYLYRPSLGVSQPKAKSIRYTRTKLARSEARKARIAARREARRARIAARAKRAPVVMAAAPVMERTPMWSSRDVLTFGATTTRPDWLDGVGIFDSAQAQAWGLAAERAGR